MAKSDITRAPSLELENQFIVTRAPKGRHAESHRTLLVLVEAKTATAAVRLAKAMEGFADDDGCYSAPKAAPMQYGKTYFI